MLFAQIESNKKLIFSVSKKIHFDSSNRLFSIIKPKNSKNLIRKALILSCCCYFILRVYDQRNGQRNDQETAKTYSA